MMYFINIFLDYCGLSLKRAIEISCLSLYECFFGLRDGKLKAKFLNFVEKNSGESFKHLLQMNKTNVLQSVLSQFNLNQNYVMDVLKMLIDDNDDMTDMDKIADIISAEFLGVLNHFEWILNTIDAENAMKQAVLLSLGDLIRFLGGKRISNLCFKIMGLLKSAIKMNNIHLKDMCISVWRILICNCNVASLAPILSVIFVALEEYVGDYDEELEEICRNLIGTDNCLLSTHISELFFIERTKFSPKIKAMVLNHIKSQRIGEDHEFETNLALMLKHLQNENADSDVKIYCLQYLEDFIKNNRKMFNNLIFATPQIDESVCKLLSVIANCSKSNNRNLQIQTAVCFGELGAIKPTLQKRNLDKERYDETTLHSNQFAMKMLKILSPYYKDIKDTRNMESLSLAIQAILQEREVNPQHEVWISLPETTRELFKPLLTSAYCMKVPVTANNDTIFWNQAQTETHWAQLLAETLVSGIPVNETRTFLINLLSCMRDNLEISSFLLPKIILQYFLLNTTKDFDMLIVQEFQLVFNMVTDKSIYSEASKDELNYKFASSFDYRPLKCKETENNLDRINMVLVRAAKLIFEVLDYLTCFTQESTSLGLPVIDRIANLQNQFCLKRLAEVNVKCGEYERAMMFIEKFISNLNESDREKELSFLVNVYSTLRDPDLIVGVQKIKKTEWSVSDQIFLSDITGNLEGALTLIDIISENPQINQREIQSMINCYVQSNQNETALLRIDGLLEKLYESNREQPYCDEIKAEPLWRLSKFDDLEDLLDSNRVGKKSSWSVICGRLLTKFKRFDGEGFFEELQDARATVMNNFKIYDSENSMYNNNYEEILHLHMLCEFEKIHRVFLEINESKSLPKGMKAVKHLIRDLDFRRAFLQTTTNVIEATLSLRRTLLLITKSKLDIVFTNNENVHLGRMIEEEVGKTWIDCAKIASKQKMFTQAHAYISEAVAYKSRDLFIEQAKFYWKRDDQVNAFKILETNCEKLEKLCKTQKTSGGKQETLELLSKARLNIARYNAEVKNVDFETNKRLFKRAVIKDVENEKCNLLFADYIDRHYFSKVENEPSETVAINTPNTLPPPEKLLEIVQAYGNSLKYGSSYVLQSMPRFLQIWFDANSAYDNSKVIKKRDSIATIHNMNTYVNDTIKILKPYQFYTAFSQLISRLCHPSVDVFRTVKIIVLKLVDDYPMQSMWFLMSALKSKSNQRKTLAIDIMNGIRAKGDKGFDQFSSIIDKIMKFAQTPQPNDKIYMSKMCPEIDSILRNARILMPLQQHFQLSQSSADKQSWFSSQVLIYRINEKFETIRSMQKPKKITLIGSDGKEYPMLLKFKDDLRIDFRFMEFVKVVNDFYRKDSETSQRCLSARTYSVIPLNEEIGIIGKFYRDFFLV